MCGNGLIALAQAHRSTTMNATPARALLAQLGLEIKAEAAPVPPVTEEHRGPQEPDADAA